MDRALAWLSRSRVVLVRYDKKVSNYIGLVQLACVNANEELTGIADGDITNRFLLSLPPLPAPCLDTPPRQCVSLWHLRYASRGPSEHRILQQVLETLYCGRARVAPAALLQCRRVPFIDGAVADSVRCAGTRNATRRLSITGDVTGDFHNGESTGG